MTKQPEKTPLEEVAELLKGQRRRWRRWFAGLMVVVLAMGFFLVRTTQVAHDAKDAAVEAQAAAKKAQDAIDLVLAQRTESRLQNCLKDNRFANAHDSLVLYFAAIGEKDPTTDPGLIADFKAKNLVPVPDCTPQGIAAFYAGQGGTVAPTMPAVPAAPSTTSTTKARSKRTTTTTAPTTSTGRPSTTSTTFRSSSTTVPTPCTGVPVPGVGCL